MGWNENEMERVSHAIVRPFSQAPKCLCERLTSMDSGQGHSSSRRSFLSSLLIHIHSSSLSPLSLSPLSSLSFPSSPSVLFSSILFLSLHLSHLLLDSRTTTPNPNPRPRLRPPHSLLCNSICPRHSPPVRQRQSGSDNGSGLFVNPSQHSFLPLRPTSLFLTNILLLAVG